MGQVSSQEAVRLLKWALSLGLPPPTRNSGMVVDASEGIVGYQATLRMKLRCSTECGGAYLESQKTCQESLSYIARPCPKTTPTKKPVLSEELGAGAPGDMRMPNS